MADFVAGDVTVTIQRQQIVRGSPGGQRRNLVKLVFGDGAITYNTGGVPLPTAANFGMLQRIDFISIIQNSLATVKYIWTYDVTNHKLVGVQQNANAASVTLEEITDTTAIAEQTLYAEAVGW
jgi:hypothetical protein